LNEFIYRLKPDFLRHIEMDEIEFKAMRLKELKNLRL